jgi:hypothetical protein
VWDLERTPYEYRFAVKALEAAVLCKPKIIGVFMTEDKVLGTPVTGSWHHFSVPVPQIAKGTPQKAAEKRQDFLTVMRALNEFTPEHIDTAITLLEGNALYRSEKILGPALWLRDLHAARTNGGVRLVWKAVALAPAGFCHPRSGMLGTLLEDIAEGRSFEAVRRAFDAKMAPTAYQRPTAAPTAGEIAVAEKLFAELKSALAGLGKAEALGKTVIRFNDHVE